jgi:hypothetical protein
MLDEIPALRRIYSACNVWNLGSSEGDQFVSIYREEALVVKSRPAAPVSGYVPVHLPPLLRLTKITVSDCKYSVGLDDEYK